MAESLKHQPFLSLNASRVEKVRDGVVRRNAPDVPLSSSKIRKLFEEKASTREKAEREPDRTLVDVSQPRQAPLPGIEPQPTESEPEPVAAKKKRTRSPESIAKFKATLASKRKAKGEAEKPGAKKEFILAHPGMPAKELIKLGAPQGLKLTIGYIHSTRSLEKSGRGPRRKPVVEATTKEVSIGDLLQTIANAALEVKRRLAQLTL